MDCGQHARSILATNTKVEERCRPNGVENEDDKNSALRATGHSPAYWLDRPPRIEEITAEIDRILSATHGRARTELRKRISNHCAIRELAIEAGKIGKPLASLLDKSRNIFDMETFRIDDEHILTDMADIHKYITEFFKEWFEGEDIDTEGMHSDDVDWQKILTNRKYYNQFQTTNKVLPHLQEIIWKALQKHKHHLTPKSHQTRTLVYVSTLKRLSQPHQPC